MNTPNAEQLEQLARCSSPGCGYPDGKPCIGCGHTAYPSSIEEAKRLCIGSIRSLPESAERVHVVTLVEKHFDSILTAHAKELAELAARHDKLVERSVGAMDIAEGEEGWDKVIPDCPMLEAVYKLRRDYETLRAELAAKDAEIAELKTQREVADKLEDTFWGALKLLNLTALRVENPGSHFVDAITERDSLRTQLADSQMKHEVLRQTYSNLDELLADTRNALEAQLADSQRPRCEHCGSTKLWQGPPDCPTCGAPQCCQTCCRVTAMEKKLAASQKRVRELEERDWTGSSYDEKLKVEQLRAQVRELEFMVRFLKNFLHPHDITHPKIDALLAARQSPKQEGM